MCRASSNCFLIIIGLMSLVDNGQNESVFVPISIRLDHEFLTAYTDLRTDEAKEMISAVQTELNETLGGSLDHFQSADVTQLRLDASCTCTIVNILISEHMSDTYNASAVQQQVEEAIHGVIEDGTVGGYRVDLSEAVIVEEPVLGNAPTAETYVIVPLSIQLDVEFVPMFVELKSEKAQSLVVEVESEMNQLFSDRIETFQFSKVTLLKESNSDTVVQFSLYFLLGLDTFNATVLKQFVSYTLGEKRAIVIGSDAISSVHGPTVGNPQAGTGNHLVHQEHVIVKASVSLDEVFAEEYVNLDSEKAHKLASAVQKEIAETLDENSELFEATYVTLLRKEDGMTVVDVIIIHLAYRQDFREGDFLQLIRSVLNEAVSDGSMAGYAVASSDSVTVTIDGDRSGVLPPSQKYVFTSASVSLRERFVIEYADMSSVVAHRVIDTVQDELTASLIENVEQFQFTDVLLLREKTGFTTVRLLVASISPVPSFNASAIQRSVRDAFLSVGVDGRIGGYNVLTDSNGTVQITVEGPEFGDMPPKQEYVFTTACVGLEEEFITDYLDMKSEAAQELISAVEAEFNEVLSRSVRNFQFASVVILRPEDSLTVVDVAIATLSSSAFLDTTLIQQDMLISLNEAVQDGNVGGYYLDATGENTIILEDPTVNGPPVELKFAFSHATMRLNEKFIPAYTDLYSNEGRLLRTSVEAELSMALDRSFDSPQLANVVLLREQGGLTVFELNIASLVDMRIYNSTHLWHSLTDVLIRSSRDGLIGGYDVYLPLVLTVNKPMTDGVFTPRKYALTQVSMMLAENFTAAHRDQNSQHTLRLKRAVETEINRVLAEVVGEDQYAYVVQLRQDYGLIVVDFTIASLIEVDRYDEATLLHWLRKALEEIIVDGRVGGYRVNADITASVMSFKPQLGPFPLSNDDRNDDDGALLSEFWRDILIFLGVGTAIVLIVTIIGVTVLHVKLSKRKMRVAAANNQEMHTEAETQQWISNEEVQIQC